MPQIAEPWMSREIQSGNIFLFAWKLRTVFNVIKTNSYSILFEKLLAVILSICLENDLIREISYVITEV